MRRVATHPYDVTDVDDPDGEVDTLDTLNIYSVDELISRLSAVGKMVHGTTFSGRRRRFASNELPPDALAAMEDAWGEALPFHAGAYTIQMRVHPKNAFASLEHAKTHCFDGPIRRSLHPTVRANGFFCKGGFCLSDGECVRQRFGGCDACDSYAIQFGMMAFDSKRAVVPHTTPIQLAVRIRATLCDDERVSYAADDVVTISNLIPQDIYRLQSMRAVFRNSDQGYTMESNPSALPWCALTILSAHTPFTVKLMRTLRNHEAMVRGCDRQATGETPAASAPASGGRADAPSASSLPASARPRTCASGGAPKRTVRRRRVSMHPEELVGPNQATSNSNDRAIELLAPAGYRTTSLSPVRFRATRRPPQVARMSVAERAALNANDSLEMREIMYDFAALLIDGAPFRELEAQCAMTLTMRAQGGLAIDRPVGAKMTNFRESHTRTLNHMLAERTHFDDSRCDGATECAEVALYAGYDLTRTLSFTALLAMRASPVTRMALPATLLDPLEFPLLVVAAMRLASRPELFHASVTSMHTESYDAPSRELGLAMNEFNQRVEARWTRVEAGMVGALTIDTPLAIDAVLLHSLGRASVQTCSNATRLVGVLPGNAGTLSLSVANRKADWERSARGALEELYAPTPISTCDRPVHAEFDPLGAARLSAHQRAIPNRRVRAHAYALPWPASSMQPPQLCEELEDMVHQLEVCLRKEFMAAQLAERSRRPLKPSPPPLDDVVSSDAVSSDGDSVTSAECQRAIDVLSENGVDLGEMLAVTESDPPTGGARRGDVTTDSMPIPEVVSKQHATEVLEDAKTQSYSSAVHNVARNYATQALFGTEWDSPCVEDETFTNTPIRRAMDLLRQSIAFGVLSSVDPLSLCARICAPTVLGQCVCCAKQFDSIMQVLPLPHSSCSSCHKRMCALCATSRGMDNVTTFNCDVCVRVQQSVDA